jgi:hypothetical protein
MLALRDAIQESGLFCLIDYVSDETGAERIGGQMPEEAAYIDAEAMPRYFEGKVEQIDFYLRILFTAGNVIIIMKQEIAFFRGT